MAKQKGIFLMTGTLGNQTFYKMRGQYYVRSKSSLRADRVKSDAAFTLTMVYADRLALASRTASQVYRQLPEAKQQVSLYRKMTSAAMQLLKTGISPAILFYKLTIAFGATLPLARKEGKRKAYTLRYSQLAVRCYALLDKTTIIFDRITQAVQYAQIFHHYKGVPNYAGT
jgi:hypothetical protein